jgi:putative 4-mercaptohistidine N1-methyltranferase
MQELGLRPVIKIGGRFFPGEWSFVWYGFFWGQLMDRCWNTDYSYESDALFAQYAELHYGAEYFGVANFPVHCAALCRRFLSDRPVLRALDVGCALGRTTLELARFVPTVTGVDYSARFIAGAHTLIETGRLVYDLTFEGELTERIERTLDGLDLGGVRGRVSFLRADALDLPADLTNFDLIFAGNLVDRLRQPRRFLAGVHQRLAPNGLLVITSPYTWLTEFTPREEWLGGFREGGQVRTTLAGLTAVLAPHFTPAAEPRDVPFVIRETSRKYQHSIAQLTVWRRVTR